ncbi:glucose/ribitol dehydrogenase [Tanacetum coccineum]|uniref:Glucose/ribitol dehydrogenase n=1 Tax=Tanacetum coccineum TaxID=301880 RepID=A0ABQ5G6T7_9ASTR
MAVFMTALIMIGHWVIKQVNLIANAFLHNKNAAVREHGVNVNANSLHLGVLNTNVARNGAFFAVNKNEKQQLQRLLNACKGIPQVSPTEDAYSSSKAGVVTLTKVMAMEMATHNIRVNTIWEMVL